MKEGLKIAILGCGNIGIAIADGLINSKLFSPESMILTKRKTDTLKDYSAKGFSVISDNKKAVRQSDILVLAVTPHQLNTLIADIKAEIDASRHIIISVVSGAGIKQIKSLLGEETAVVRAMPNTAIAIQESMTCLSSDDNKNECLDISREIFEACGKTLVIDEAQMVPATALCACGIAFFLRAIRAASQGGIEIGFHAEDALLMAAQTAKGAASLIVNLGNHPEGEVDKVTTPMGCTISGLNQMEHHGFSSALIRGIVTSAEKANKLYSVD